MLERPARVRRPMAIPIRVLLTFLAGVGVASIGVRLAQDGAYVNLPIGLQICGMLLCVWSLYEGTRTIRLSHLARPVRPKWGNREVALTSEGVLFIVILLTTFIAAFLGKSNLLLLVFSLLAATFILNGAVTNLMLEKNRVRRGLPRNIMAGETLAVEVTLANQRRRLSSWMLVLQDQIRNSREILQPRVLYPRVPVRSERSAWYEVRFGERGVYEFGPLKLLTRFPLGFVERGILIDRPDKIIVHPRVGLLTSRWRSEAADAEDLMRHPRSRTGTHEDDFHRLREYRSGDNPKAIHWLSTARSNQLMVREYHETRDRDLIVCLDLWGEHPPEVSDAQVERAVSFTASLIVDHCRRNRGASVAIGLAGSKEFVWYGSAGPNVIPHIMDELSQIQGSAEPPLSRVVGELQGIPWSRCHRILVTTRPKSDVAQILDGSGARGGADHRHPFRIVESAAEALSKYIRWDKSEVGTGA